MKMIDVIAGFVGLVLISIVMMVIGVTQSDYVGAQADKERALIAGEVAAQLIENEDARDKAAWWAEIRAAVEPVAIFSMQAVSFFAAVLLIGSSIALAIGGGRWGMNKAASPIVTQVGAGMAIVTHGGESRVVDLYTGARGNLFGDADTSPERAITARAIEMEKAASARPVVMSALPSAGGE